MVLMADPFVALEHKVRQRVRDDESHRRLLAEALDVLTVGPGTDPNVKVGPLVSESAVKRVRGYLQMGVDEGATVATARTEVPGRRRHDPTP